MSSNIKPPDIIPITDPLEAGGRVTELLHTGKVRAIILDNRQMVMVVHYEDGSPKTIQITGESIPYLLNSLKITTLPGLFNLEGARKALIEHAGKSGLVPKSFISSMKFSESLESVIPVLTSKVLTDSILLLVMGPPDLDSLSQAVLVAANLE